MIKKDTSVIGYFEDTFNSVPHTLRFLLALATQHNVNTDHVDISQTFTQGEFLEGDEKNGKGTFLLHFHVGNFGVFRSDVGDDKKTPVRRTRGGPSR